MISQDQSRFPLVSILLVTWNHESYISPCLDHILSSDYSHREIIVVDNGSSDNSLGQIRRYSEHVFLIANKSNLGLSKALNQALEHAKGDCVLTLNPDTLLETETISRLWSALGQKKTLGAACPKLMRAPGIIDCAGVIKTPGGRFINRGEGEPDQGQFDQPDNVLGPSGACALYKRAALESIKIDNEYFDEDFFAYKEDVDVSLRIQQKGWQAIYEPGAIAWHPRRARSFSAPAHSSILITFLRRIFWEAAQWPSAQIRFVQSLSFRNDIFLCLKHFSLSKKNLPALRPLVIWPAYLVFRPYVFAQIPVILKNIPAMLQKRSRGYMNGRIKETILFINHEESRTGAPKLLFEIAKRCQLHYRIVIISLAQGSMHEEFHKTFPDIIYPYKLNLNSPASLRINTCLDIVFGNAVRRFILKSIQTAQRFLRRNIPYKLLHAIQPDIVYVNSLVSHPYAVASRLLGIPTLYHIHELSHYLKKHEADTFKDSADAFIAVSQKVHDFLDKDLSVDPKRIRVIPGFVSSLEIAMKSEAASSVVQKPKNPAPYVVVGIGAIDAVNQFHRKGVSFFLEANRILSRETPGRYTFIWMGRHSPALTKHLDPQVKNDSCPVDFLGEIENPYPILKNTGVLALPSRQDPFPLVVLEAMALGVPVIAFRDGGGASEALTDDCGLILPDMSAYSLAHGIASLNENRKLREVYIANAKAKQKKDFDIETVMPRILELIHDINGKDRR